VRTFYFSQRRGVSKGAKKKIQLNFLSVYLCENSAAPRGLKMMIRIVADRNTSFLIYLKKVNLAIHANIIAAERISVFLLQ
jgi:hypothetical protein